MRFPKKFQRGVNVAGLTVLGTDTTPTGNPNQKASDNQMSFKLNNINGFPIQRIAVGYACTGAGLALSATLFVWDDESRNWFASSTGTLTLGKITFLDQPTLGDTTAASAGALDLCLVVSAAGGDPDGTYTFAIGADLSNDTGAVSVQLPAGGATAANQTNGTQKTEITDGVTVAGVDAATTGQKVVEQQAPVYEDNAAGKAVVEHRYTYANVTAQNATVVKSGAGLLHTLTINKWVTGLVVTVYDNTAASGTKIATFTLSATDTGPVPFPAIDALFSTGLTINLSAAADVSVTYRS